MKKLYKVLLIVSVIAATMISFSIRNLANAKTYDTKFYQANYQMLYKTGLSVATRSITKISAYL